MGKTVKKIVLTGGPCGGKTTGVCKVAGVLETLGWKTIVVPEAATETITSGVLPNMMAPKYFQTGIIMSQMAKEKVAEYYASHLDSDKILILCDRGLLDNRAYCTEEDLEGALSSNGMNKITARDSYDGVFHLVTAADGAEEFYTLDNNVARSEGIELAKELDYKIRDAWMGHPHFRLFDNKGVTFEEKISKLTGEICNLLGEPVPYEIERSFLIDIPDFVKISSQTSINKVDILQFYLKSENGIERRIRQRGEKGNNLYFYTEKVGSDKTQRVERERRIAGEEFLTLSREIDTSLKPIAKERYCFLWESVYYELDVYPFWNDKAILEVEMSTKDQELVIPPFINVIKEVTKDERYKNRSLAENAIF